MILLKIMMIFNINNNMRKNMLTPICHIYGDFKKRILEDINKNGNNGEFEYEPDNIDKHNVIISDIYGTKYITVRYFAEFTYSDYVLNTKTLKPTAKSRGQGILSNEILDEIKKYVEKMDAKSIDNNQNNEQHNKNELIKNIPKDYKKIYGQMKLNK